MPYQKDKSYAWVVVGAGSIVLFVGPSTYTAYGSMYAPVEMSCSSRIWMSSLLYSVCFLVAPLAGTLPTLNTHRKIVMFGLFIAVCGLTITGVSFSSPSWSLITFSTFTGLGIGLAIHDTFLLLVCHFERFRGLSVGILQASAGLSQAVTPFIYDGLVDVKDRFYIRALMTAVAFMSASFYISPILPNIRPSIYEELEEVLELREQAASRRSSANTTVEDIYDTTSLHSNSRGPEQTPLVVHNLPKAGTKESLPRIGNSGMVTADKLDSSQVHTLPNIPEEGETSPSASNDRFDELMKRFHISPIDPELEQKIALKINKGMSTSTEGKLTPEPLEASNKIKPLDPELLQRIEQKINPQPKAVHEVEPAKPKPPTQRPPPRQRISTSLSETTTTRHANMGQFRYRLDSIFDPDMDFMEVIEGAERKKKEKNNGLISFWKEVFKRIDWSLLRNWRFVNMAVGAAVTLVVYPNFTVLLTVYLMALEGMKEGLDGFDTIEMALVYICSVDIIARLAMSYLSDFPFFNRKIGFLIATFLGGLVILATTLVQDAKILHWLCCIYGVCHGTLVVTESLMLADAFGIALLPASYGIMNGLKAVFVLFLTPAVVSPVAYLVYTIYPFKTISSNETLISGTGCDPLGLFEEYLDSSHGHDGADALSNVVWQLRLIAIPGLCCSAMWAGELIWDYYQEKRTNDTVKPDKLTQIKKQARPPRPRSSSSPLA